MEWSHRLKFRREVGLQEAGSLQSEIAVGVPREKPTPVT